MSSLLRSIAGTSLKRGAQMHGYAVSLDGNFYRPWGLPKYYLFNVRHLDLDILLFPEGCKQTNLHFIGIQSFSSVRWSRICVGVSDLWLN